MPKEELHLQPLREVRGKKRKAFGNSHPSEVYFQVIGNGTAGGTKSLFLYTDHQRYLFNCGEGTQRLCMEHCPSKALGQMGNIFITARTWQNLGGLLGTCLTMRAAGAPDVTIHGPKGCMDMYDMTKTFIVMHDFNVIGHNETDGLYEDNALTIRHIILTSSGEPLIPPDPIYTFWKPDSAVPLTSKGTPIMPDAVKNEAKDPIEQSVTAYVISVKPKPGRLLVQKCVEMGVPTGPLLGELKLGRDVVLDDGTVVKAAEVLDASTEDPQAFIVIECPTKDYLSSLLSEEQLKAIHPDLKFIRGIFHFSPPDVIETDEYATWVNSFPETTKHVMLNDRSVGYGSRSILEHNLKLHTICPEIFPNLLDLRKKETLLHLSSKNYDKIKAESFQSNSSMKFHVRPLRDSAVISDDIQVELFDEQEVLEEINILNDVPESLLTVRKNINVLDDENRQKGFPEYPIVTFLGTGSSVPSKYRCVSSILVETEPGNFIMLDSGEGTLLQLHRQYGRQEAMRVLRHIKAIYLSHLHADHHLGLINLVLEREKAFREANEPIQRLFILAPSKISAYLSFYHHKFEPVLTHLYQVCNEHLLTFTTPYNKEVKTQMMYPSVLKEVLDGTGLQSIKTSRAVHCPSSFCVSLVTKAGFKLVYSGDTRPNESFVQLATEGNQVPDLLIHEATMEHSMLADCISKRHSTFKEAAAEGRAMKAKFTMLTHFSQRYCKLPILEEIEAETMNNLGIAFDGMAVRPATFEYVRLMYPALKAVYAEAIRDMELQQGKMSNKNYTEAIAESLAAGMGNGKSSASVPKKKLKLDT